jgi:hypothetical protein
VLVKTCWALLVIVCVKTESKVERVRPNRGSPRERCELTFVEEVVHILYDVNRVENDQQSCPESAVTSYFHRCMLTVCVLPESCATTTAERVEIKVSFSPRVLDSVL